MLTERYRPFTVELPDRSVRDCYSPASIAQQYFTNGEVLTVEEFVSKSRNALQEASSKVEEQFGYVCSGAAASIANIEHWSAALKPNAKLRIVKV
ncbi:MSMEG_0570 family nitrogen starvation response protein [Pelagicoccus sp. SDUM812002]|uniref:MSMEG_0570 family nitrogen starvation response protein n=1 Tax=Pelagicoccus sp. SDUM812002 TaxID=3041266 RepID=UPI00280E5019|nr:MSMEG_0570 family nitrogen starvation response protein [Pelagicoccus sp. SDUM812002]MDQ8184586.1 MSMEG_0570 family nitrogen starvation response protein [Pelagicoccus sp. SDUM812002]